MKKIIKMSGIEWVQWSIRIPGLFSLSWIWDPDLPLYFTVKFLGITVMTKNYWGWEARLTVKFLGRVIRR
jgi:hypothetical protein